MPINITGAKGIQAARATEIRKALNLPEATVVSPAATKTMIAYENGVTVVLPYGVATINAETARQGYEGAGLAATYQPVVTSVAAVSPAHIEDDEAWATAVAPTVLPETRAFAQATEMYQRVHPKGGEPYIVAFVGPNLIGVVRLKGSGIDLKFKGRFSALPAAEVSLILKALNMQPNSGAEYYSAHVHVPGAGANTPLIAAVLGGFYGALRDYLTSGFPQVERLISA